MDGELQRNRKEKEDIHCKELIVVGPERRSQQGVHEKSRVSAETERQEETGP